MTIGEIAGVMAPVGAMARVGGIALVGAVVLAGTVVVMAQAQDGVAAHAGVTTEVPAGAAITGARTGTMVRVGAAVAQDLVQVAMTSRISVLNETNHTGAETDIVIIEVLAALVIMDPILMQLLSRYHQPERLNKHLQRRRQPNSHNIFSISARHCSGLFFAFHQLYPESKIAIICRLTLVT
jgi:hypothetical protein